MQKQKRLYNFKHQRETVQKQQKQVAAMNTCNFYFFYTATPGVSPPSPPLLLQHTFWALIC